MRTLDAPGLISIIQPGNTASIRVAERLDMGLLRESRLRGQQVLIFGLDRPATRHGLGVEDERPSRA